MEALQLGMDDKKAAMKRVVKQKYHIKSLLDFAEARASPCMMRYCVASLRLTRWLQSAGEQASPTSGRLFAPFSRGF